MGVAPSKESVGYTIRNLKYQVDSRKSSKKSTRGQYKRDVVLLPLVSDIFPSSTHPLTTQLYEAFLEPSIQFYFRGESDDAEDVKNVPERPYYASVDAFYESFVLKNHQRLFNSEDDMVVAVSTENDLRSRIAAELAKERRSSCATTDSNNNNIQGGDPNNVFAHGGGGSLGWTGSDSHSLNISESEFTQALHKQEDFEGSSSNTPNMRVVEENLNRLKGLLPVRPIPCAVAFLYEATPRKGGSSVGENSTASGSEDAWLEDSGAPPLPTKPIQVDTDLNPTRAASGSAINSNTNTPRRPGQPIIPGLPESIARNIVVVDEKHSVVVIGFIGLVNCEEGSAKPVAKKRKGSKSADGQLRGNDMPWTPLTPTGRRHWDDAGDTHVPVSILDDEEVWEFCTFFSKSAGDQFLSRALFTAASLYKHQCERAKIPGFPFPKIQFSSLIVDVPFLSFLREMRLRLQGLAIDDKLIIEAFRMMFTDSFLYGNMQPQTAAALCTFLAKKAEKVKFASLPPIPDVSFHGFVDTENPPENMCIEMKERNLTVVPALACDAHGVTIVRAGRMYRSLTNEWVYVSNPAKGMFAHRHGDVLRMGPNGKWYTDPTTQATDVLLSWVKAHFNTARDAPPENENWVSKTLSYALRTRYEDALDAVQSSGAPSRDDDSTIDTDNSAHRRARRRRNRKRNGGGGGNNALNHDSGKRNRMPPPVYTFGDTNSDAEEEPQAEAEEDEWTMGSGIGSFGAASSYVDANSSAASGSAHASSNGRLSNHSNRSRRGRRGRGKRGLRSEDVAAIPQPKEDFYVWWFEHDDKDYYIGIAPKFTQANAGNGGGVGASASQRLDGSERDGGFTTASATSASDVGERTPHGGSHVPWQNSFRAGSSFRTGSTALSSARSHVDPNDLSIGDDDNFAAQPPREEGKGNNASANRCSTQQNVIEWAPGVEMNKPSATRSAASSALEAYTRRSARTPVSVSGRSTEGSYRHNPYRPYGDVQTPTSGVRSGTSHENDAANDFTDYGMFGWDADPYQFDTVSYQTLSPAYNHATGNNENALARMPFMQPERVAEARSGATSGNASSTVRTPTRPRNSSMGGSTMEQYVPQQQQQQRLSQTARTPLSTSDRLGGSGKLASKAGNSNNNSGNTFRMNNSSNTNSDFRRPSFPVVDNGDYERSSLEDRLPASQPYRNSTRKSITLYATPMGIASPSIQRDGSTEEQSDATTGSDTANNTAPHSSKRSTTTTTGSSSSPATGPMNMNIKSKSTFSSHNLVHQHTIPYITSNHNGNGNGMGQGPLFFTSSAAQQPPLKRAGESGGGGEVMMMMTTANGGGGGGGMRTGGVKVDRTPQPPVNQFHGNNIMAPQSKPIRREGRTMCIPMDPLEDPARTANEKRYNTLDNSNTSINPPLMHRSSYPAAAYNTRYPEDSSKQLQHSQSQQSQSQSQQQKHAPLLSPSSKPTSQPHLSTKQRQLYGTGGGNTNALWDPNPDNPSFQGETPSDENSQVQPTRSKKKVSKSRR